MRTNAFAKPQGKRSFIGFYVTSRTKQKLAAITDIHGCTMSDLMTAFAERAETLSVFLHLPNRRSEAD